MISMFVCRINNTSCRCISVEFLNVRACSGGCSTIESCKGDLADGGWLLAEEFALLSYKLYDFLSYLRQNASFTNFVRIPGITLFHR